MQDVVKLVLQAEGEARRILHEAEAEAERLATEARRRAQEIVQTLRRETAQQADALVGSAEQEALRQRREQLAQAAAEVETAVHLDESATRDLIAAIVRCVSGAS